MNGLTVSEIANILNISIGATRKRIETAEIKPISREALYDKSVVNVLNEVKMGRPKKVTEHGKPKKAKVKESSKNCP